MRIGILYICTGKYSIFWKSFYESSEKYFLANHPKTYFVFTDARKVDFHDNSNVKKIYQKNLVWPYISMMRFKMFTVQQQILRNVDYLFFCNANLLFVDYVGDEILPVEEGLVALNHPSYWNKSREEFVYDINPACSAYIPPYEGKYYFMGAFNGGKTKEFLQMSQTLANNIDNDLQKGILALWYDESHLNKYMLDKPVKILDPSYGYPEGWDLPFLPKIKILDKRKIFDVKKIKKLKTTITTEEYKIFYKNDAKGLKLFFRKVIYKLGSYLR